MAKLISTNPSNNYEVLGEVIISSDAEIQEKVALANRAKISWKELGVHKRVELFRPICDAFEARSQEIAELITKEMGKPIRESKREVAGFIQEFQWLMENAEKAIADEITFEDEKSVHKIVYEPWGVVVAISPWNYPFGMAVTALIPNLLVGNTVVFKISEECPLMGKLIEEIMMAYDLPEGVFSEIYGAGDVGQKLAESEVDFIWFTGSTKVGQLLYKIAADKFIPVMLEMGGSSPCIVFDDVDIEAVVEAVYPERYGNCGQVCDAVKRLIVHESIVDQVVEGLKKIIEIKKQGDPIDSDTDLGPLVAKRQLDLVQDQVDDAVKKGANVVCGGKIPEELKGAFYEPTLLSNVTKDMRVWTEEVFGPVLPVISFTTEEEAVELANDTPYGLGSRVFSKDRERAERCAVRIEAGTVELNYVSRWLSCNPFGGYKASGMGRGYGVVGLRQLCQMKVVSMEK